MGADVIRFDRLQGGLDAGRWPLAPSGRSLFWAGLNKGKRSIAIDMKSPRGREIVTEMGATAMTITHDMSSVRAIADKVGAYLLADYDVLVRAVLTGRHIGLFDRDTAERTLREGGRIVRRVFNTAQGYKYLGVCREDLRQGTQKAERATDMLGALPQAVIDGNAICDGDSGCIVEWGASDCQVSGNRWERCRIGILSWEVTALHAHDNEAIERLVDGDWVQLAVLKPARVGAL